MSTQPDAASPGPLGDRITVTLHYLVERMDRYADQLLQDRFGVTYSLFMFIAVLSSFVEPPTVTALAERLNVSKAAVSKRVPGLVGDGWIHSIDDPANARYVRLALTPKAAGLLAEAAPALDHSFTEVFDDLHDVDLDAVHHDLKTIIRHLETKEHDQ